MIASFCQAGAQRAQLKRRATTPQQRAVYAAGEPRPASAAARQRVGQSRTPSIAHTTRPSRLAAPYSAGRVARRHSERNSRSQTPVIGVSLASPEHAASPRHLPQVDDVIEEVGDDVEATQLETRQAFEQPRAATISASTHDGAPRSTARAARRTGSRAKIKMSSQRRRQLEEQERRQQFQRFRAKQSSAAASAAAVARLTLNSQGYA